jgi:FkbM family methyltransferase
LNENVFDRLRAIGRRLPVLKRVFSPVWEPFTHACWKFRNILTKDRPIRVSAGKEEFLLCPEGQIAELLWVAEFEAAERDFVSRVARPGMRVVNIGANIGLYTIMTGKLIGPKGQVHAFEPSTATYARLERNIRLNKLSNVAANNIALSDTKGSLMLRSDPRNNSLDGHRFVESLGNSSSLTEGDEIIVCDTLDGYFSRTSSDGGLPTVDLVIMDVEGAEWMVLKGAKQILSASPRVVLVLECSQNRREVGELLSGESFQFYTWNSESGRLDATDFVPAAAKGTVIAYRGATDQILN